MPIDFAKLSASPIPLVEHSWNEDNIILYHLGLGAGADWLNPRELGYTYEKNLRVLPCYAVIPPHVTIGHVMAQPGMDFPHHNTVHGEHEITLHGPIPTAASVVTSTRVVGVYDKGSGALLIVENETRLKGEENILFTNRWSLFIRGEQGEGKDPDARAVPVPPQREPDYVVESPILTQLAHIYRLSGDKISFHIDPEVARKVGFEKPILQGLGTFGVVCKAVVDSALDYDVGQLKSFRGRFSKPVFPGDTIVTKIWREADGLIVHADAKERGVPVFSSSFATLNV